MPKLYDNKNDDRRNKCKDELESHHGSYATDSRRLGGGLSRKTIGCLCFLLLLVWRYTVINSYLLTIAASQWQWNQGPKEQSKSAPLEFEKNYNQVNSTRSYTA
jgi:hypothetical protein